MSYAFRVSVMKETGEVEVLTPRGLVSDFAVQVAPGVDTGPDGGAKQSFKEECDINNIMAKAQSSGVVSWLNQAKPQYGDFAEWDFQGSMNVVAQANEMFAQLPSSLRKRFGNDPGEFLEFMSNPDNQDEAVRLGLAAVPPVPAEPVIPPKADESGKTK